MQRFLALFVLSALALRADTVLVLPFFNHSKTASLDWIGESIAETVRDALASQNVLALDREDRLEAFRRQSLRPGAELTHASVIKIGQSLDASQVIYGYYDVTPAEAPATGKTASRGSLKITARLVDLKRLRQGPEFAETGALEDLSALETHLGWQALEFLIPKTAPSEQEFRKERPPVRVDAVESYVRGLLSGSAEQRHRYFTQSARLDANYSQPRFQLGKIYWDKREYKVAAEWLSKVLPSDPRHLEAQFYLGLCRYHNSDFTLAAQSFQLVATTVPLNEVFNNLGASLSRRSAFPDAIENYRKALEGDSADPDFHFNLGYALWKFGQFTAAADSFRAALDRNPNDDEAAALLARASKSDGPKPGDLKAETRERLKTNYDETAYRQLQAELEGKK
jgi:tetratricopeptide (TPR) repeat protein